MSKFLMREEGEVHERENAQSHIDRVVKKIESSRRDGKCNGRFSNFRFPNGCKIELCAFRVAGAFIRVDGEMRWLPAYFDNPALSLTENQLLRQSDSPRSTATVFARWSPI